MRTILLLTAILATFPAAVAQPSTYKLESQSSGEVFSTTVLKVYQAQGDGGTFAAYVVDWRGQEVVVVPSGVSSNEPALNVGDPVRCMMSRSLASPGAQSRLRFSILPVTASVSLSPTAIGDEPERIEMIAEEVRRRRALREGGVSVQSTATTSSSTTTNAAQREDRMSVDELKRRASARPATPTPTTNPPKP